MPAEAIVPFVGGSYQYRSRGVSVQQTVNLYPEVIESQDGKTKLALIYTPGSRSVATVGTVSSATCRGLYYSSTGPDQQSRLYAVYGFKVYRIDQDMTVTEIGQVSPGSGTNPVVMTDNGFNLVVADGSSLYSADLMADNFTVPFTWKQVTLPIRAGGVSPITPSQVAFINQRLVINDTGYNQFYFSNPASVKFDDQFAVPNFYTAESSADSIRNIIVCNNRLWIFGDRSYEVWSPSGGTYNDPLGPISGSASQIGTQSYRSVAAIYDKVFWLGSSDAGRNSIWMGSGLENPVRISTNAIEHQIGQFTDSDAGIGWAYTVEGHTFYSLTFQISKKTFVYDVSTNMWHERSTQNWTNGVAEAWEPLFGVTAYNDVYHGSSQKNSLLLLDPYRYVDADDKPLVRSRVSPIFFSNYDPVSIREFYLDMEIGTTPLLIAQGKDPQAMLEVSRDGGSTWESMGWKSIGVQGAYYYTTVKWTNLGVGRAWACKVTFSDPSPIVIYGARILTDVSGAR